MGIFNEKESINIKDFDNTKDDLEETLNKLSNTKDDLEDAKLKMIIIDFLSSTRPTNEIEDKVLNNVLVKSLKKESELKNRD